MQAYKCKKIKDWFDFGLGIRIFKEPNTIRCYIIILLLKFCIEIKKGE